VRQFVRSLKPALKLSLPALETLAVIAYKQPVTAPEVNEIRGVESSGVFGSLLARKLIATAGRKQVIGRPILYKTTREFLLRFGLKDVAELPSMEEFEKLAAIELDEPETGTEPEAANSQTADTVLNSGFEEDADETDDQDDENLLMNQSDAGPQPAFTGDSEEPVAPVPALEASEEASESEVELPESMPAVMAAQESAETTAVTAAETSAPTEPTNPAE
jgi:segregation and condensation protein B